MLSTLFAAFLQPFVQERVFEAIANQLNLDKVYVEPGKKRVCPASVRYVRA